MIETIQTTNYLLSFAGIALVIAAIVLVVDLYTSRTLAHLVRTYGLVLGFFVTLGGTSMTLVYSEVFGLIPCGLCWLQRIALFPQVLLLGTALYVKDALVARYGIVLSLSGLLIALYHHYLQMGGSEFIKCPAAGEGAACTQRFFFEFGFMTFPLMSAFTFIFLIALYFYVLKVRSD